MKSVYTLLILLLTTTLLTAQTTASFEGFFMEAESYLNGSEGSGGYSSGNVFLPNAYNDAWEAWNGWSISNVTDNTTPGLPNQYSAITGTGFESSSNYAVAFVVGHNILELENMAVGEAVNGFYVTNATYTYLSMQDGDQFAKKFGGVTGNDPDFLLLTIKKYLDGELSIDSVDFYLADYRFEDNTMDYLIDEWTYIDLTSLGAADSLQFTMSSSDSGMFGMNTPAYFCVDNIITSDGTTALEPVESPTIFEWYPNPAADFIILKNTKSREVFCVIYDVLGNAVLSDQFYSSQKQIDIQHLTSGTYFVEIRNGAFRETQVLVKK